MMLGLAHFRITILALMRSPAYAAATLALPSIILVFIGSGFADTPVKANAIMAAFSVFAVMGIAFFQFGIGIAEERASPWSTFVRVLPAPASVNFAGTILAAIVFSAAAVGIVFIVALLIMPVAMEPVAWLRLVLVLAAGSIPLALIGIALGYVVSPRAAVPVANIVNLVLAFGGGLFIQPRLFPDVVDALSQVLPTRHIVELAWAAVLNRPWESAHWMWLLAYAIGSAVLAGIAYRRDEGQRYR